MQRKAGKEERHKGLRFTHVHLENWRNFRHVKLDLQGRAFLVGPNASGKSNLLDAFRFLRDIVSVGGGFQEAVRKRGGVSSIRCLAARQQPNIVVGICVGSDASPNAWRYEIEFSQDQSSRPMLKKEVVEREGRSILHRPNEDDMKDAERLTQTYLEQVNANREFRGLADFFNTVRYLHLVPQLVREPDRSAGRRDDPYGGDFLEQVAGTVGKTRDSRLRRIQKALRVAVPQLREVEMRRDDRGTPHLRGRYEHWRPKAGWQTEEQFSDGTLRLMGLLWAVLDGSGPLLLEEPELSMHPEIISFLPQMFARVQRRSGRQMLVSTHSPDLLRDEGIGADEVVLLLPSAEGTEVRLGATFPEVRALLEGGLSLWEAVAPLCRPERAEQLPLFSEER